MHAQIRLHSQVETHHRHVVDLYRVLTHSLRNTIRQSTKPRDAFITIYFFQLIMFMSIRDEPAVRVERKFGEHRVFACSPNSEHYGVFRGKLEHLRMPHNALQDRSAFMSDDWPKHEPN